MSRTLVIGDVHGCSTELEMMLRLVQPTRCISVGDLFRKGPDPLGVWAMVQEWSIEAVFGNHEAAMLANSSRYPEEIIDWVCQLPLWIDGVTQNHQECQKWRVVHAGVNPYEIEQTTRAQAIVVRRWPNDSNVNNPFWWTLYEGERLILYGHDAARGLRDNRPYTLGLDTGCVYGNALTGYILETCELIQIPSQQVYVPIK